MHLFPRCQFVVTTHSPQVIGSVAARHVRLLSSDGNGDIEVTEPIASRGRDTNYVLEGIMGTPEQDPQVDDLFARFDRLVDDGAFDDADRVLDELDGLIEGKSSRVSLRRAKCRRLRGGRRDERVCEGGRTGSAAGLEDGPTGHLHRTPAH